MTFPHHRVGDHPCWAAAHIHQCYHRANREDCRWYWQRAALAVQHFQPTPRHINGLPEPLRRYIHDLQTICDPAGMVQEIHILRTQNEQLQAYISRLSE